LKVCKFPGKVIEISRGLPLEDYCPLFHRKKLFSWKRCT